jgi:hypothetical protein
VWEDECGRDIMYSGMKMENLKTACVLRTGGRIKENGGEFN